MLKRNLAVLVLVGGLLAGGAYAWAQTTDTSPSAPTTAPSGQQAPAAQGKARAAGQAGILRRVVHGDLVVRGKDGFQNVTYDRGTEKSVSDNTLTITRPDGKTVSFKLTSTTRYRGVKDASQLQTGKQTIVLSKDGNALMVGQRSGEKNGNAPSGAQGQ